MAMFARLQVNLARDSTLPSVLPSEEAQNMLVCAVVSVHFPDTAILFVIFPFTYRFFCRRTQTSNFVTNYTCNAYVEGVRSYRIHNLLAANGRLKRDAFICLPPGVFRGSITSQVYPAANKLKFMVCSSRQLS